MVKLYYTPTSCGAASFISAYSAGVKIEAEQVDLKEHKTTSGADFYAINPKGNVPCLVLDDGVVLNEGSAILQWIADQSSGDKSIAPANGTSARYLVQNALNYVASEVHPSIGGLFAPNSDEVKAAIKIKAATKLSFLEKNLIPGAKFLVGDRISIADYYLWIVLTWTAYVGIDLTPYPSVKNYVEKISALANVKAAQALMATKPTTTQS